MCPINPVGPPSQAPAVQLPPNPFSAASLISDAREKNLSLSISKIDCGFWTLEKTFLSSKGGLYRIHIFKGTWFRKFSSEKKILVTQEHWRVKLSLFSKQADQDAEIIFRLIESIIKENSQTFAEPNSAPQGELPSNEKSGAIHVESESILSSHDISTSACCSSKETTPDSPSPVKTATSKNFALGEDDSSSEDANEKLDDQASLLPQTESSQVEKPKKSSQVLESFVVHLSKEDLVSLEPGSHICASRCFLRSFCSSSKKSSKFSKFWKSMWAAPLMDITHDGIFIGRGEWITKFVGGSTNFGYVVHYSTTTNTKKNVSARITTLEEFMGDSMSLTQRKYRGEGVVPFLTVQRAVDEALHLNGHSGLQGQYSIFSWTCTDWCTYCISGHLNQKIHCQNQDKVINFTKLTGQAMKKLQGTPWGAVVSELIKLLPLGLQSKEKVINFVQHSGGEILKLRAAPWSAVVSQFIRLLPQRMRFQLPFLLPPGLDVLFAFLIGEVIDLLLIIRDLIRGRKIYKNDDHKIILAQFAARFVIAFLFSAVLGVSELALALVLSASALLSPIFLVGAFAVSVAMLGLSIPLSLAVRNFLNVCLNRVDLNMISTKLGENKKVCPYKPHYVPPPSLP